MVIFQKVFKLLHNNVPFSKSIHTTISLRATAKDITQNLFINFQEEKPKRKRKVSIIGAGGYVGSACGYNLMLTNFCDEIVLVDIPKAKDKVLGTMLDTYQAAAIHHGPKVTATTDIQDTKDSDVIVVSCGVNMGKGQTRLDIIKTNLVVFKAVIIPAAKYSPNCVFVIVTNPCDVLAWVCWKYSGFDKSRCIGTGTILESARFRYYIAQRLGVHPSSIDAYYIGEHGQTAVPIWTTPSVFGTRLREIDPCIAECNDKNKWEDIHKEIVQCASRIITHKECTNWGISLVTEQICRAILTDSDEVFPCSTSIQGFYGVKTECFISYPVVLGNTGVKKIVSIRLSCAEMEQLNKSADTLDKVIRDLKL